MSELKHAAAAVVRATSALREMSEWVERGRLSEDDPKLQEAVETERAAQRALDEAVQTLREAGELTQAIGAARAHADEEEAALEAEGGERFGGPRTLGIGRLRALLDRIEAGGLTPRG